MYYILSIVQKLYKDLKKIGKSKKNRETQILYTILFYLVVIFLTLLLLYVVMNLANAAIDH